MTTVITNPFLTKTRYAAGLDGVFANLSRLEDAFDSGDDLEVCSVLADMAACAGIQADQYPSGRADSCEAFRSFPDLCDAIEAEDERDVRDIIRVMLDDMSMRVF